VEKKPKTFTHSILGRLKTFLPMVGSKKPNATPASTPRRLNVLRQTVKVPPIEAIPDSTLRRLKSLRQMVEEYPGPCPNVESIRWRLRRLRGDFGSDLRDFGVYRDKYMGKIYIDPQAFMKTIK